MKEDIMHKESLTIVKVGGAVLEDPQQCGSLLDAFAAIEGKKILVHGGGRTASTIASQLGIKTRMVDGRRITDADMLLVAAMVYGGLVNRNIVPSGDPLHHEEGLPRTNKLKYVEREYNVVL